jgi:hypothetical protein
MSGWNSRVECGELVELGSIVSPYRVWKCKSFYGGDRERGG